MTLSVYVGLRAIAWLVHTETEVVQYGIKRINLSFDNYYEFIAGLPVSKRINRRVKKQTRRNLWRYKSRRNSLRKLLAETIAPYFKQPKEYERNDMLMLRVKALDVKITNSELANVLMNLQQKRGYKRLRGSSGEEEKIKDYSQEILKHQEKIEAKGNIDEYMQTLYPNSSIRVEYNERQLKEHPSIASYLLTKESSKNLIFMRASYEKEFNDIMDRQKIDEALRQKIFRIIYWQHPLKKGKVAHCDYERNRTVTHASNPMYQEFRIWRDVMNIVIYDADKYELDISFEHRQKWVAHLMKGSNLTKAKCCKDLGYKSAASFTWYSGNAIAGNPVAGVFNKLSIPLSFGEGAGGEVELWQDLFSATDEEKLIAILASKYSCTDYQAEELSNLDLHSLGWSDFSTKAIRKLLPLLQTGIRLKEAIMQVYGKADFNNVALRNVVLEQHYFSYKSLTESLCKRYNIDEVKFEIDYLLKLGNKGRKELAKQKRADEKFLKENAEIIDGKSSYDVLKYKLWKEAAGISPYEPGKEIPLKKLFTREYNIDHIIAKSTLFETGYNNMILSPTALNEKKDRSTAFDFAASLGLNGEYEKAIEKLPAGKKELLLMKAEAIPADWLSRRQNSDYNTKCFAGSLSLGGAAGEVTNIPNKLINKYISEWQLNQYKEDDARHYLCKAWVLANFNQQTIAYFDNIKAVKHDCYNIKPVLPRIDHSNAPIFMPRIKFVRRQKAPSPLEKAGEEVRKCYTPRFSLHQESVYGRRVSQYRNSKGEDCEEVFYKIRQPVSKLSLAMIDKIMDKKIRHIVRARIIAAGSHEEGIQSLIQEPAMFNERPIKSVSIRVNAERIFALHSTDDKGRTFKYTTGKRPVDFVYSNKNYAVVCRKTNEGKLIKTVIALMKFLTVLNSGFKAGKAEESLFTLQENNIVSLHNKLYYVVGASDSLMLRDVYTLSATNNYRVKADDWVQINKINFNQCGEVILLKRKVLDES